MNDFIVIASKRDEERFRQFSTGENKKIMDTIKITQNSDNIWAINSSFENVWSMLKKNDRVYFAKYGSNFSHYGIVYKKIINKSIAIKIWGDTPKIKSLDRLILFSSVIEINKSFHTLCNKAKIKPSESTKIYLSKNKLSVKIPKILPKSPSGQEFGGKQKGAPGKKEEVFERFIRDTIKVKQLKKIYDNKCQICNYIINISKTSRYSEVHHLYPLGEGGDDDFDNMLVLCPTHHVEFDYKVIGIDIDKKTIIDKNNKKINSLTMLQKHKLNKKNIEHHLNEMKNK